MLEMLLIASGSFLAAMFCVWTYRLAKGWHASRFRTHQLDGQRKSLSVAKGNGVVELGGARYSMSNSSTTSRKPWGW